VDTVDNICKSLILLTFCKCVRLSSAVALNTRFIMLSLFVLVNRISTGRLDRIELCTGFCGWILENRGWPVDNSAPGGSAARRGEGKVRKGWMVLCRRTCPKMTMSPNSARSDNLAASKHRITATSQKLQICLYFASEQSVDDFNSLGYTGTRKSFKSPVGLYPRSHRF